MTGPGDTPWQDARVGVEDELPLFPADPVSDDADLQTADSLLTLMASPGVGSGRAIRLAEHFRSWERLEAATAEEVRRVAGTPVDLRRHPVPETGPDTRTVCIFDSGFPSALRRIKNPPAVLWVRGHLTRPSNTSPSVASLAVVGTRTPTEWWEQVARVVAT
jgi:predicted Rossmann fold nucleotide-binding protein DprA/Smf involved in DNA uptake